MCILPEFPGFPSKISKSRLFPGFFQVRKKSRFFPVVDTMNIYLYMNEFYETSLNANLPPMKDVLYVIEVLLNDKLDNEKLHQLPSDDKTADHRKMKSTPNEFTEASL